MRFGGLVAELGIEAAAWRADLIGLAAPMRPGLRHRLRAWSLNLTMPVPVVLLPVTREDGDAPAEESVVLLAFR